MLFEKEWILKRAVYTLLQFEYLANHYNHGTVSVQYAYLTNH